MWLTLYIPPTPWWRSCVCGSVRIADEVVRQWVQNGFLLPTLSLVFTWGQFLPLWGSLGGWFANSCPFFTSAITWPVLMPRSTSSLNSPSPDAFVFFCVCYCWGLSLNRFPVGLPCYWEHWSHTKTVVLVAENGFTHGCVHRCEPGWRGLEHNEVMDGDSHRWNPPFPSNVPTIKLIISL